MRIRSIIIMFLLLIVLSVIYYLDYHRKVEREAAEMAQSQLVPFSNNEVDAITISNSYGNFALEKRKDGWWMVQPVVDRADQILVEGKMLAELEKSEKSNPFEMDGNLRKKIARKEALDSAGNAESGNADDYGLSQPKMQITIRSSAKGQSVRLSFGDETPVKGEIYLADETEPNLVYTAPARLRDVFDQDMTDLRDKTILDIEPELVSQFWIRRPNDSISGQKQQSGQWAAELSGSSETLRSIADTMAVENLFRRVRSAKIEHFVTTATLSPARYGLDHPRIMFELRQENAPSTSAAKSISAPATLLIGDHATSTDIEMPLYYAMRRGRNAVFTIHQELVDALLKPVATFRDRRIFTINPDDIQYLQIEAIASSFALERDRQGQWRISTNPKTHLDQDKVQNYINYCLKLRIEEEPEPPISDPATVRLDKPTLRVTMATGNRTIRQGFEIGATQKGKPFFYGRRSPTGSNPEDARIFLLGLPLTGFFDLVKTPDFFTYKRLVAFENDTVERVVIESRLDPRQKEIAKLTLSRGEQEAWNAKLNSGLTADIPGNLVEVFLLSLQRVDYVKPVENVTSDMLDKEELKAPPCIIRLIGSGNRTLGEVAFGDLRRAEQIIMRSGAKNFYMVDTQSFTGVAHSLDEIMVRLGS